MIPVGHLPPDKVAIDRDGACVSVHITCTDGPAALALYRLLCEGARSGALELNISTIPRKTIDP